MTQSSMGTAISTNTTSTSDDATDDSSMSQVEEIPAYVDFTEFYRNVEIARQQGTLPPGIDFEFQE